MKQLTAQMRDYIKKLAREYLADKSEEELNRFKQKVLAANGIDYTEYVLPGKGQLRRFMELMPDIFTLRCENKTNVWYCALFDSQAYNCAKILGELVEKNGRFHLSKIDKELKEHGIDYRAYSGKKGLKGWIESEFGNYFKISDDGYYLMPIGNYCTTDETSQMNSLAFMSWWENNSRILNSYTHASKNGSEWSETIARALWMAILGINTVFTSASGVEQLIVFDTTAKTAAGNAIYCVLTANPSAKAANAAEFVLEDFCCPAEEDSELSKKIKEKFPDIIKTSSMLDVKYKELQNILMQLTAKRSELKLCVEALAESIETGRDIDDATVELICQYHDKWKQANELLDFLGTKPDDAPVSIFALSDRLEFKNRKTTVLKNIIDICVACAQGLYDYCKENMLHTTCDIIGQDIDSIASSNISTHAKIMDIISYYICLWEIGTQRELTDSVIERFETVKEHFPALTERVLMHFFMGKSTESESLAHLGSLNDIADMMASLESGDSSEDTMLEFASFDMDALLDKCINFGDDDDGVSVLSSVAYFPATRLEKMIVYAKYDEALDILKSEDESFCPAKSNSEIAAALQSVKSHSDSLGFTFYECADRLLKTIGNHNRTAEKYLIAGLICDADRCSQALLELYMSENNTSSYLSLWRKFGTDFSDDFAHAGYLLEALASDGQNTINQYLAKHVYILYMPQYAKLLADIAQKYGLGELAARCTQALEYITSMPEYNDFELSVINAHDDEIKEYLTEKQFMLTLFGYTQDEQNLLTLAAQSEAADQSIEKSAAERLYDMQKNKNGTVERLVWNALASQFIPKDALILLGILNDEKRPGECIALYECYKDRFTTLAKAREIYITNLINADAAKARDFIAANMMDFMNLLCFDRSGSDELYDTVKELACHQDEHISQFFASVAKLRTYLSSPVLCSIITLSGELRDLVTDNEKLSELGLPQSRIESCAAIFKTDSYSRGRDARSISERLYTFVGISQDAAREFAMLALSVSLSAIPLVWKIVCDYDNDDEKLSLFRTYPQLQQTHIKEYCTLLLQNHLYSEFLDVAKQTELPDAELAVGTIIAKCHLPEEFDDISCADIQDISDVPAPLTALLIKSLCTAGHHGCAHEFMISHFDEMLARYSHDEIMTVVSANDAIEDMQKAAFDVGSENLVVYIYENCDIGSYDEYSKDLYSKLVGMYKTCDEEQQQNIIKQLKNIYCTKNSYISEIALMEIRHLAGKRELDENAVDLVGDELENVAFDKEQLTELMLILEPVEHLLTDRIYRAVVKLCSELGLQKECIAYIAKISSTLFDHPQNDIFPLLCRLYTDAIGGGYFSDEWRPYAEQVCTMLLDTPCYCDAAFCMYNIQKTYGNIHASKFILSALLERKHSIPASMLASIEAEAKDVFGTTGTGIFDLFTEAVSECDMSEITDYCRFCGSFIKLEDAMLKEADSLTQNKDGEVYSLQNSEILLKLLYKYPANPTYWQRCINLPFEDNTVALAKVLYKACLITTHDEELWNRCISTCERYCHDRLLSSVLLDCAKSLPSEYAMPRFRTSLAHKANANPLYFSQVENRAQLTELVSVLCKRLEQDSVNRANYSAIRDLVTIAVATDSAEAFEIMMDSTEKYVLGEYSNLGFAVVCRLILRKRFEEAQSVLARLKNLSTVKYHALISKLAQMDLPSLTKWGAEETNKQLLKMILPDGNYPDIMQINEFALSCTSSAKAEEGARLLCELIDNIPTDYGCHMALFMVCKQIPHRTDYLHRALCGLIRNEPAGNSKTYYSRTRRDYAVLLANINAVIIARHQTDAVSQFDGYDFRKSAREFYCEYENEDIDARILGEIEDAQTNIENALMNQQSVGFDIMCSVVLSWITGNWTDVLTRCWRENIDISHFIEYYSDINNGFARSVLRAVYSLDSSERSSFMSWLEQNCARAEKPHLDRAVYLYNSDFYSQISSDVLEGDILDFPFEEYSLFNLTFDNTVRQFISKAPRLVYPCAMLVASLAFFGNSMIEFWQTAMTAYENSNDVVANGLFAALDDMWKRYRISHKKDPNPRKNPEKYEALYRVTGVFSGNEQVIAKVSSPDFHSWSCINMVMGLLYTRRANEVNRLKMSFADNNKKIVDAILIGVNPNKTDTEKINAIKCLYDDVSRALICFILKLYDKNTKKPSFVKEATTIQLLNDMYFEVAEKYPTEFDKTPRRFLWIETAKIHENAYSQINEDAEFEEYDIVEPSAVTEVADEYTLSFVANLLPGDAETVDIHRLWLEHENMTDNHSAKLDITARIYSAALASDADREALTDYAMRYGVDYYRYCMSQKDYDAANSAIKEMAAIYDSSKDVPGYRLFKDIVCNTALHELLHRGYTNIRSMADDYAKHKTAFIRMRNMLPASSMQKELDDVNAIYTSLETLVKCFGELSTSHTSAIKKALINAKKQLGEMKQMGWVNVKLSVLNMIQDEINRVDQRPILSFEVLTEKSNKSYGSIYGQIRNMGKTAAQSIVIQLVSDSGDAGDSYELPMLENGDMAAFEIDYCAPDDADTLSYSIVASYSSNNEKYNDMYSGKLTIQKEDYPDFSTGLYLTDRPIMDFSVSEDGSVVSDNFFGRNEEKLKIQSVFAGGSFIDYKNVIVNGIRRAGKTSILNYLLKFAEANCSDAVTCMVTCEGISTNSPIQYVLIDAVIKHLRLLAGENADAQQWDSFTEKWKLPEGCADRNADDLQYFYRELKQLNGGKGLVLVIDEIDILFEYVEKNQGLDSTLFPALRTLLCNMYCQEAVHLVICGSNKLIRYMDGGTLNQLFQQFGDNIIEVGRLLTNDMNEMLTKPYELHYPHVQFTKEALGWIWKYTSGLVWYAKLLSNCALTRAKSKGRCVVYPSDVADGLFDVIGNDNFFKSLITSCRPSELKILDAMQSHTSKASEYISLSKLMEILSDEFSQKDIETIIGTLERMNIVNRNLYDRYSYRFAVELYWHYFRVYPSNYERVPDISSVFKKCKVIRENPEYENY